MKKMLFVLCCVMLLHCRADEVLPGFLTRTLKGVYTVTSTVDITISGTSKTDLLVCVPYPESNTYQDIIWKNKIDDSMIAVFPETGEKFIRYAKHDYNLASPKIQREFIFRCWSVVANLDLVTQCYPYDTNADLYKIYTRAPVGEDLQIDPSNSWVIAKRDMLNAQTGGNPLAYARAAHALVASEFSYNESESNLVQVVSQKGGQCGGLTAVVVSLLRSAGIPARPLVCKRPSGTSRNHVWGEFFLQGYGWVPFDVTQDILAKTGKISHFGVYNDCCIIMSRDMHQSVTSVGGRARDIKLLQSYLWWYWYSGTKVTATPSFNLQGDPGCLRAENCFIPHSWIASQFNEDLVTVADYEKHADLDVDGDGTKTWDEFIFGTDPNDADSVFRSVIKMNGRMPEISWDPVLSGEDAENRIYRIWGSETLENGGIWLHPTNSLHRFFRVSVEMK